MDIHAALISLLQAMLPYKPQTAFGAITAHSMKTVKLPSKLAQLPRNCAFIDR
jgi:hypothetical protein